MIFYLSFSILGPLQRGDTYENRIEFKSDPLLEEGEYKIITLVDSSNHLFTIKPTGYRKFIANLKIKRELPLWSIDNLSIVIHKIINNNCTYNQLNIQYTIRIKFPQSLPPARQNYCGVIIIIYVTGMCIIQALQQLLVRLIIIFI